LHARFNILALRKQGRRRKIHMLKNKQDVDEARALQQHPSCPAHPYNTAHLHIS
jgi:hypothetical protein